MKFPIRSNSNPAKPLTGERTTLLRKLDNVSHSIQDARGFNPRPEDMGRGTRMRLKRLFRYRGLYLAHIGKQIRARLESLRPDLATPAKTFWGRNLILPTRDSNARTIRDSGTIGSNESRLIRFFIKELQEGDVFYDIGANYGFYTALAQEVLRTGEIHVFEPNKTVFRYLKQLSSHRVKTFLNNIALADVTQEITFFDCYEDRSSGKSTVMSEIAKGHRWHYKTTTVPATTLDEYCSSHKFPTIVKLDVEGAERKILMGGERMLKDKAPLIAIELWSGKELSVFSLETLAFLKKLAYVPFFITEEGDLKEATYPDLSQWLQTKQDETNFVFKKVDHAKINL